MYYDRRGEPGVQIYAMVDPRTARVRYVGQTFYALAARYAIGHRHENGPTSRRKWLWIRALENLGLKPIMVILETCERKDALAVEAMWIRRFDPRFLFNRPRRRHLRSA